MLVMLRLLMDAFVPVFDILNYSYCYVIIIIVYSLQYIKMYVYDRKFDKLIFIK